MPAKVEENKIDFREAQPINTEGEYKNARIRSADIFIEDHGVWTAFVDLEYGGANQGFGGYAFGFSKKEPRHYMHLFVMRCCEVVGVDRWSALPGKMVRVCAAHSVVHGIGSILMGDEPDSFNKKSWFFPADEFAEFDRLIKGDKE